MNHLPNILNMNPEWKQLPGKRLNTFCQALKNLSQAPKNPRCQKVHEALITFLEDTQNKESAAKLVDRIKQLNRADDVPHTKGRLCGGLLNKGEKAYKCHDCMTEDNSVLCSKCFQLDKHQGHDFQRFDVHGGCCDCGDVEKWKEAGFCDQHSKDQKIEVIIDEKLLAQFLEEQTYGIKMVLKFYAYLKTFKNTIKDQDWELPPMGDIEQKLKNQTIKKASNLVDLVGSTFFYQLVQFNKAGKFANAMTDSFFNLQLGCNEDSKAPVQTKSVFLHMFSMTALKFTAEKVSDLCITMFPMLGFREKVTEVYVKLYNTDPSFPPSDYSHLSSQLLTSYMAISKLIKEGKMNALKYEPECKSQQQIQSVAQGFLRYYYDIRYLARLYGDASIDYFKLHGQQKRFVSLGYYRVIFNQFQRAVDYYGLDEIFIDRMIPMVKVMQRDQTNQISNMALRELYTFITQYNTASHNILRPQQRLFALIFFTRIRGDLSVLDNDETVKEFFHIFGVKDFKWEIRRIIRNICSVFITASRLLQSQIDFEQKYTFYSFYLRKSHQLFNLDAILLKIALRMCQVYRKTHPFDYGQYLVQGEQNPAMILRQIDVQKKSPKSILATIKHLKNYVGLVTEAIFSDLPLLAITCVHKQVQASKIRKHQITRIDCEQRALHYYECLLRSEQTKRVSIKLFKKSAEIFFKEEDAFRKFVACHKDPDDPLKLIRPENGGSVIHYLHFRSINSMPTQKYKNGNCLPPYMDWKSSLALEPFNEIIHKAIMSIKMIYDNYEKAQEENKTKFIPYLIVQLWRISIFSKSQVSRKLFEKLIGISWVKDEIKCLDAETVNTLLNIDVKEVSRNEEDKKKQQLKEKLAKKRALMKQKMQKNTKMMLESENVSEMTQSKNQSESVCCLCKQTSHSSQLYFLGFVTFTSGNSWLSTDPQLNCIPVFDSCKHTIHRACFENTMLKNNIKRVYHYCPLCKKATNIILPQSQAISPKDCDTLVEDLKKIYDTLEYALKHEEIEDAVTQSLVFEILFKGFLAFEEFMKNIKLYRAIYKLHKNIVSKSQDLQLEKKRLRLTKQAPEVFEKVNSFVAALLLNKKIELGLSQNFTSRTHTIISLLSQAQINYPHSYIDPPQLSTISSSIVFPCLQSSLSNLNSKYRGKCLQCGLITNNQMICLGCPDMVTCTNCTLVKLREHAEKYHKGCAVYVKTSSGDTLYIMRNRCWKFQSLYQDYMGRIYDSSKQREDFNLNNKRFQEVKKDVLYMRIEQKVRYKQNQTKKVYNQEIY